MKRKKYEVLPSAAEVEQELDRVRRRSRSNRTLRSAAFTLTTAAAAAILVAILWMPVLQIYGSSMVPTLQEGEIVLSVKEKNLQPGDIVAFYYGNQVLIKRYIAGPGAWVDILEDGTVLVDGEVLPEPYIREKAYGICDLVLPYQVPEGAYFLMGDQRDTSVDSRHSSVGCIALDDVVGKIVYRVWPLDTVGPIE